jgi:membrane protease YdiL (CAAX protease family)
VSFFASWLLCVGDIGRSRYNTPMFGKPRPSKMEPELEDEPNDGLSPEAELPDDVVVSQPDNYWTLSRQPWMSLVFSAPLLLLYEVGVILQPPDAPRNGADVWLRNFLAEIGLGQHYFLLPFLVVIVLLCWQHVSGRTWRIERWVLVGMAIESLLLACLLLGIARTQRSWFPFSLQQEASYYLTAIEMSPLVGLVNYFGAGFYEEVLFRLLLLPLAAWLLRKAGLTEGQSWGWAILGTSIIFAAAHHLGQLGDPWALRPLVFRTVAGCFFGLLFLARGFGITAWSHALYDVIVGSLS